MHLRTRSFSLPTWIAILGGVILPIVLLGILLILTSEAASIGGLVFFRFCRAPLLFSACIWCFGKYSVS